MSNENTMESYKWNKEKGGGHVGSDKVFNSSKRTRNNREQGQANNQNSSSAVSIQTNFS